MKESVPSKVKVHTVYKADSGERVPSVTTILGILNKPALLDWAWKCGCDGLDYKEVRDHAGDIGTLAHYLIMCYLSGQSPDTSEYSTQDIDKAENCLLSFYEWEKQHKLEVVLLETPLVSNLYNFGGTIDCYGYLDEVPTLIDFKTGKAIYPEFFYQLAAYQVLLEEHQYIVDQCRILRIGRNEDEGFEDRCIGELSKQWEVFTHCLSIYQLRKQIRKEE